MSLTGEQILSLDVKDILSWIKVIFHVLKCDLYSKIKELSKELNERDFKLLILESLNENYSLNYNDPTPVSTKISYFKNYFTTQKKFSKREFKEKKATIKVKNPSIRVLKEYSRFDKEAKEKGFLKNPVSSKSDPFEVYKVSSSGFMSDLSPMILGPVRDEYGEFLGYNIEDVHQGLKVWSMHMNGGKFNPKDKKNLWTNGNKKYDPNGVEWVPEWEKWSKHIRFSGEAKRRRCEKSEGCSNIPLFSYYKDKRIGYVDMRKLGYVRWYAKLVVHTRSFKYLKTRFEEGTPLILLDPDGQRRDEKIVEYTKENATKLMRERINDKNKIFGHGFVLACLLLDINVWDDTTLSTI